MRSTWAIQVSYNLGNKNRDKIGFAKFVEVYINVCCKQTSAVIFFLLLYLQLVEKAWPEGYRMLFCPLYIMNGCLENAS